MLNIRTFYTRNKDCGSEVTESEWIVVVKFPTRGVDITILSKT